MVDSWFHTYLEIDDVTVVDVDLTPQEEREAYAFSRLDKAEQHRWSRFRFDRPRREFALCRSALRAILCGRLDCDNDQLTFRTSRYGKPFGLVDGIIAPITFNISHSGKHGLIACAQRGRIGVDVEDRTSQADLDGLSKIVFGPDEQADVASKRGAEKLNEFFTLWTMKEAMIKALGLGFAQDPSKFQIPSSVRRGARASMYQFPGMPDIEWKLRNLSNSEFAAAIVHESFPKTESQ